MSRLVLPLLLIALAGCARSASTGRTAGTPQQIVELAAQTTVYECPKCGMMFDAPGQCSMGCGPLVETNVAYVCPADNKPVEHSGKCPRCEMNARVVKTAAAATVQSGS